MEKTRRHNWLTVRANPFLKRYVDDYDLAYVRIFTKDRPKDYSQYLQITYFLRNRKKYLQFEIYNDEELKDIQANLPGIKNDVQHFPD